MAGLFSYVELSISLFLMVVWSIQPTSTCSCLPQHTQHHFCNSDFVIKARIKSAKMSVKKGFDAHNLEQLPLQVLASAERSYHVWVQDVYKGHQFIAAGSQPTVITSYYASMCGVTDLIIGKTYVIMGMLTNAQLRFTNCNWREPWVKLSKHQRQGFRYWYEKNCASCQIDTCGPSFLPCEQQEQERADRGDSCIWDPMNNQCENMHSSCVRHDGGACKWMQTNDLLSKSNCTNGAVPAPRKIPRHRNRIYS